MKDDMELKRALDALPREVEPPAEAWSGIRAKIVRQPAMLPRRGFVWPEHFEPRTIRIAAGIAAIGIGLTYLGAGTRADTHWIYSAWVTTGARAYPTRLVTMDRMLRSGDVVATPANGWALIRAGDFGSISVSPGSRMRLINARPIEQRVALMHGGIDARINAPPRLFIVETPSGTVTDMGCAYRLDVDSTTGLSRLTVTRGWVTFDNHGREALVPQGFTVVMGRGGRPGTPVSRLATPALHGAISRFDGVPTDRAAVTVVLAEARKGDAVTLWHMLPWVTGAQRDSVYDELAAFAPPPDGVSREGVVRDLNPIMLRLWWEQLPGTLKIDTSLRTKLWTLWLKVASWL